MWNPFTTEGFLCRGTCGGGWSTVLVIEQQIAQLQHYAAYTVICLCIGFWIRRRHPQAFQTFFVLMSLFFFTCGTTHLFDFITFYWPIYWAQAHFLTFSAQVSTVAALLLTKLTPQAMRFPSASRFERLNRELMEETYRLRKTISETYTVDEEEAVRKVEQAISSLRRITETKGGSDGA